MSKTRNVGFVPSPMIRNKSLKTLAKQYQELGEEIAALNRKQELIRAQLQGQIGIGYSTVVKLESGSFSKINVIPQEKVFINEDRLRLFVSEAVLKKCRKCTKYVRVTVAPCTEDVYNSYFER